MQPFGNLFIQTLQSDPTYFFAVVITIVVSITLHELAHGWVAIRLGDDTPLESGHMTLNPLVHMGLISIILLCMMGIAFGAMPVNRNRLRGKYAEALVALAGPAMNLVLGLIGSVGFAIWWRFANVDSGGEFSPVARNGLLLLQVFGATNFALLLFNLIPIPPLDGSYVLANLVPAFRRFLAHELARGAMTAIFFAMFLGGARAIFVLANQMTAEILNVVLKIGHA
ncbi:MAG: site-2 protease family protein [Tepidisphaeraceae bacterium]